MKHLKQQTTFTVICYDDIFITERNLTSYHTPFILYLYFEQLYNIGNSE